MSIHKLSLLFSDPKLEERFQTYAQRVHLVRFRIGLLVIIFMTLLACVADYSISVTFMEKKLLLRFLEVSVLFIIFLLTYHKNFRKKTFFLRLSAVLSLNIFLLFSYQHMLNTNAHLVYNTADVLILISIFFLFGFTFLKALIVAFFSLIIYLTYIYITVPHQYFILYCILFIYTIILSAIGAYLIELHNRKSFLRKMFTQKLLHKLHAISKKDPLTQLFNRLGFNEIFEYHFNKFLTKKETIGVLLIDIDNFKSINDNYGHIVGDEVLKTIARLLEESNTHEHTTCRWGGEEFFVLLENCNEKKLLDTATTILQLIDSYQFDTVQHCSVSIGATLIQEEDTKNKLLQRVDQALYQAKEEGKNRIVYK